MKKSLLIALVLLLVLAAGAGVYYYHRKNKSSLLGPDPLPHAYAGTKGLAFFSFQEAGGMEGGYYSLTFARIENGTYQIEEMDQPTHNSKEKIRKNKAGQETAQALEEIFREYRMDTWTDLSKSEEFALDAPSTTIRYVFDGIEYEIGDNDRLPEGGGPGLWEIKDLIKGALK